MTEIGSYLPEQFRLYLEQHYFAEIREQARLEHALQDPDFLRTPDKSLHLYGDHGGVHAHDVATRVLQVLDTVNGILIPRRTDERMDPFMRAYGVMVAYLHDIGMVDSSNFGRRVHAEYATQVVFSPAFDHIMEGLWQENCGEIPNRLQSLAARGLLEQAPETVFREMLAMANCHSKSAVPGVLLDDPDALRRLMLDCLSIGLHTIYRRYQREAPQSEQEVAEGRESDRRRERLRLYTDFPREAFRWLSSPREEVRQLVSDVVDTLRAVRCADALRQRGTVLKTSGDYEVFVDGATGDPIYALRRGQEELFLLCVPDPIGAGEANLAGSELLSDGNLRITFHRGSFATPEATQRAAACAALVVDDVQLDVTGSFPSAIDEGSGDETLKGSGDIQILLENVDDNPQFASLVAEHLQRLNPQVGDRVRVVASLERAAPLERGRYLAAPEVSWDRGERQAALDRISRSGHRTEAIDPCEAFEDVKLITLRAGEVLIEAGTPASFVYVPLGDGLEVLPLGGYRPLSTSAWIPVGTTGVIRGATRNATVVARHDLTLLMIPRDVYLEWWYRPYNSVELVQHLRAH